MMLSSRREAAYQFAGAIGGILSLLGLLPAIGFAAASGMIFDAPGSENDVMKHIFFFVMMALPLVLASTVVASIICMKRPTNRHLAYLLCPFGVWALTFATIIEIS